MASYPSHEKLLAKEYIDLQDHLYVTSDIRSFDATSPECEIRFHGVAVHQLLNGGELRDLHASSIRAPHGEQS